MDPVSDAIDPSWWGDVLAAASLTDPYEPPELLATSLEQAAADPAVAGFKELVLQVLAMASSAMLNAEDWLEPFTPAMQFGGMWFPRNRGGFLYAASRLRAAVS